MKNKLPVVKKIQKKGKIIYVWKSFAHFSKTRSGMLAQVTELLAKLHSVDVIVTDGVFGCVH